VSPHETRRVSVSLPEVIAFFDGLADEWDENLIRDDEILGIILDGAQVGPGDRVLDVACGTGILTPYLLARDVAEVAGVDVAPRMIQHAASKYDDPRTRFLNADILTAELDEKFDRIVVYNSFPHFENPRELVTSLVARLVPNGLLTVAHGQSREAINARHESAARHVSIPLLPASALADLFRTAGLVVTVQLSNDRMYQVTGQLPARCHL
jgi:2-polyprenyl-3-methyl-5-hydroxy-6-metoxy-1,4-benzoquinol methylase